jgi:hypothetical protein
MTPFLGPQPWEAPDPLPVMRRELKLLLIEMNLLEPIREVWIHGEVFAASRLSMIRIMARRKNAATVVA